MIKNIVNIINLLVHPLLMMLIQHLKTANNINRMLPKSNENNNSNSEKIKSITTK